MTQVPQHTAMRALPARPNLEHLKNEAKSRLDQLRLADPQAQLSDAQFRLAREYGFSSWRELKARVDLHAGVDPTGDWIGQGLRNRLALHVHRTPNGGYAATADTPDRGEYGWAVDDFQVEGDRLSFTVLDAGALYEARWEPEGQGWIGEWKINGGGHPLNLSRGVFPPNPTVAGLDGLWDGVLRDDGGEYRFSFRIRTDAHGTSGMFTSPDTNVRKAPLRGIHRQADTVRLEMRTFVVEGPMSRDGDTIEGVFRKDDWTAPLVLTRRKPGAAAPQKTAPASVALPAETLERFAGAYRFSQGRVLMVELADGRLSSQYDGGPSMALTPTGACEFRYAVGDSGLTFFEDEEGPGVRLKLENFVDWGRKQP